MQHLLDVRWHGLHHDPGNHCLQTTSLVPCAFTTSRLSITEAGGLSDTPGAERSTGGENGDTVTHIREAAWRPCVKFLIHKFWWSPAMYELLNLLLAKSCAHIFRRYRTWNLCHLLCVSFMMLSAKTNNKCASNKVRASSWSYSPSNSIIKMKWRQYVITSYVMKWLAGIFVVRRNLREINVLSTMEFNINCPPMEWRKYCFHLCQSVCSWWGSDHTGSWPTPLCTRLALFVKGPHPLCTSPLTCSNLFTK